MRVLHSGNGIEPVRCIPKTRISKDYALEWDAQVIEILFDSFGDGGGLVFGDEEFEIEAKGPLGRTWNVKQKGESAMKAERKGIRSSIKLTREKEVYLLERKHLLSPVFLLSGHNGVLANFEKPALFSRVQEIEVLDIEADFLTLAFAFWLVTSVRRAATGNRRV